MLFFTLRLGFVLGKSFEDEAKEDNLFTLSERWEIGRREDKEGFPVLFSSNLRVEMRLSKGFKGFVYCWVRWNDESVTNGFLINCFT